MGFVVLDTLVARGEGALRKGTAFARLERMQLRRFLRDNGLVLVVVASLVGATTGTISSLMSVLSEMLHGWFYGLEPDARLSTTAELPAMRTLLVMLIAGLVIGATIWLWRRRAHEIVDPIEANALHGGRMSLTDSLYIAVQSMLSSGFGLSLGIEGGYTQIAGAIGSKIGRFLKRRRIDVRLLVGAGTAGAIAGAFDAPIAGAAYAFELIVGSYTVPTLAPVVAAAVSGTLAAQILVGHTFRIPLEAWGLSTHSDIVGSLVLGIVCGLIGIALMRGVTATERLARASRLPIAVRPVVGGLIVGMIAIVAPHVLGAGHGAMEMVLQSDWPIGLLLFVLVFKVAASAVSLGAGFRGGLFSTSLYLGTITGALVAEMGVKAGLVPADDVGMLSLVGTASFGAAVIGAPMTMALLAVEVTEDLSVVGPVLLGVVAATLTVRQVFGYSFATWRFHLRGEAVLGGADIGWTRETTARNLMRQDITVVPVSMSIAEFKDRHAPGTVKYAIATDRDGAFAGLVDMAGLYAEPSLTTPEAAEAQTIAAILTHQDAWVEGVKTIDRLLPLFEEQETEILIVVDSAGTRRVEGLITEAYTLKRYRLELEARQKEIFGT